MLAQQWATPNQLRYRNEQKAMRGKGHFFNQDFRLDAVVIFAGEEYLGMKRLKESYPQLLFRLGKYEESGILQTVLNHLSHFGEPYDEDFWPKFFQAYPELTKFRKDL